MSSIISILPDNLINKIAAGEVVDRPASVVKELVENALDAGATAITVDVEQSGQRLIRVTDNGSGMSPEDARACFERHATSKIASEQDLEAIRTMGFRGEALASIAAVSQVVLTTAERGSSAATLIRIEGGAVKSAEETAAPAGSQFEISHLFFNTPARLKFLKSPATEFSHIIAAVSRLALARPDASFRLRHNGKLILDAQSTGGLAARVEQIHGPELARNLMPVSVRRDPVRLSGLVGKPSYSRADRLYQEFYVNGRFIRNPSLLHALTDACRDLVMRGRHPVGFLFLELNPSLVDVNVHPAKAEVRFRNQSQIHDLVRDGIREALRGPVIDGSRRDGDRSSPAAAYHDRVREAPADFRTSRPDAFSPPARSWGESGRQQAPQASGEQVEADRITTAGLFSASPLTGFVPIAQLHDSFIIAQGPEGMALVDQHAAHERVLFEGLQDSCRAGSLPVQHLLLPITVELSRADHALLSEAQPALRGLGFEVEDFGAGAVVIKAVPSLLAGGDPAQLLLDILGEFRSHGSTGRAAAAMDGVLSVMACHPAIKVNRKLSLREMERLLRDLFACRNPHTCPHGRPTIIRFSLEELRRLFKRE